MLLLIDLLWGNYGHFDAIGKTILHKTADNQKVLKNDKELCRFFVQLKIIKEIPMPYYDKEEHLMISKNILCPNLMVEHKRFDAWGFSVLALKNYYKVLSLAQSASLPDTTNLLNLMNVKYVLWSEELDCPGYELIRKDNLFLYKNTNCLPRALLVKNHEVMHDEGAFSKTLQSRDFNPSETVLLNREPDKFSLAGETENLLKDSVNISEYKNNMITADIKSSRSQFLVLSETYYPGWKAYIDGTEATLYEANFAFRAVAVPAGRHKVVLKYEPLSFMLGACISIAAFVVFIFLLIFLPPPTPPSKRGKTVPLLNKEGLGKVI